MKTQMNKESFGVSHCPTCGSPAIRKVRGTWAGTYEGKAYSVKAVEYYSCPQCEEKVYPPEAMRRIQQASPAYSKSAGRRTQRVTLNRDTRSVGS